MAPSPNRSNKLTPELMQRIYDLVAENGMSHSRAAAACNICRDTWLRWKRRGEMAREVAADGRPVAKVDLPFIDLLDKLDEADAALELKALQIWVQQMPTDWKAAAELLARRFPAEWGKGERSEVLHLDLEGLPDDVLAAIANGSDILRTISSARGRRVRAPQAPEAEGESQSD
jgi:hypothetical protein